jgi:4-diphosphocytidyl-2-C-methyl-D-erythritol kinase
MNHVAAAFEAHAGHTEAAPAKINLALHVTGRRPDGYHDIETLAVFADFGDAVSLAPGGEEGVGLVLGGPSAAAIADTPPAANLVVRAANELIAAGHGTKPRPVRLVLSKRIPVAAGLGGGSADAAATLRLLNREWDLGLGLDALVGIGQRLGADVPMCLLSQPLVATGIGERLTPVGGMPAMPIVLAHPGGMVSTAGVFARVTNARRSPLPAWTGFRTLADVVAWLKETRNDLEEPAAMFSEGAPAAATALGSDPECLFARMTGTGAAAFGICPTADAAARCASRIGRAQPGWWVVPATTGGSNRGGTP